MKKIGLFFSILSISMMLSAQSDSITFINIDLAKEYAADHNKNILMVFAGSDWCRPCMQFKMEVLQSDDFGDYAAKNLVVLYLDFPARKKNKLEAEQKKHNETLADKYNPYGAFPAILLIDKDEQILGELEFKHQTEEEFIDECKKIVGE